MNINPKGIEQWASKKENLKTQKFLILTLFLKCVELFLNKTDSKSKAMYFLPFLPKKTSGWTYKWIHNHHRHWYNKLPQLSHQLQHHSNTNRLQLKLWPTLDPPHPIWCCWWLHLVHRLLPLPRYSDHPWSTWWDRHEIKNQESNSTSWHPKNLILAPWHWPKNKDNSIHCYGTQHCTLGLWSMDHHQLHQMCPSSIPSLQPKKHTEHQHVQSQRTKNHQSPDPKMCQCTWYSHLPHERSHRRSLHWIGKLARMPMNRLLHWLLATWVKNP